VLGVRRFVSALARRAGKGSLRLLGPRIAAEVVEQAIGEMVATTPIPGGQILFAAHTPLLIARARSLLTKEPDTVQWIDHFPQDAVMWDIGANVGQYSLYAACHKHARVVAFEPLAANYYILTKNLQLNHLEDRVVAYCVALGDRTRLGYLNTASAASGAALNQFGQLGDTCRYWSEQTLPLAQGMMAFSVDSFVRLFDPPFPSYLKIDVDGLELPILKGAKATLADERLKSVFVELSLSDPAERNGAVAILEEAGFGLTARGDIQTVGNEQAANHLFERVARPGQREMDLSRGSVA